VYLNGEYLPEDEAKISIFDRAVLFGDAIYEVAGVLDGKLIDFDAHMARYHSSLGKLGIPVPLDNEQVLAAFRQLVKLNNIDEGLVYMQITRGEADRDFLWQGELLPTVFMFTQDKLSDENKAAKSGVILKSVDDIRWARRDIKSVNECGSTSFFIVTGDLLLTHPLDNDILPGITRKALVTLCNTHGIRLVETRFRLDEVLKANEAFISGASSYVLPVVQIDEQKIGSGTPGPYYQKLYDIYIDHARASSV